MFERQFSYLNHILILSEVRENAYNNVLYYFKILVSKWFIGNTSLFELTLYKIYNIIISVTKKMKQLSSLFDNIIMIYNTLLYT